MSLLIRKVEAAEAGSLSSLARRSKAYWGYSAAFMTACDNELVVTADKLEGGEYQYMVAENKGKIMGYYALQRVSEAEFELEALFVEPEFIGSGIGRALLTDAKKVAAMKGGRILTIQGDPNAEKFYLAAGGVLTGKKESASIPGRFLPTFSISLPGDEVA